jgi:hypothetical protein
MRSAVRLENRELNFFQNETDPDLIYLYTQTKKYLALSKVTARPQKKYRYSF